METKTVHIQFNKENKYIGKVDPGHDIQDGHFNVEVSHDEHEDVEKNKEDADHIHKFLGGKQKIDNETRLEGLKKMQEQQTIDEISDETKSSYILKAHKDIEKRSVFDKDGMRKVANRIKGQQTAAKKLKGDEHIDIKESFGAQILNSIINNKQIDAQEQCAIAMSNIIKSKIDDMRVEVAQSIYNKSVNEAKDIYHDTYRSALETAYSHAASKGYTLQDHEQESGHVDPAPYAGETKRLQFTLHKDGKEHPKKLNVQIYKRDGDHGKSYELNHYIN